MGNARTEHTKRKRDRQTAAHPLATDPVFRLFLGELEEEAKHANKLKPAELAELLTRQLRNLEREYVVPTDSRSAQQRRERERFCRRHIVRLRTALAEYGEHGDKCPAFVATPDGVSECNCGLREQIEQDPYPRGDDLPDDFDTAATFLERKSRQYADSGGVYEELAAVMQVYADDLRDPMGEARGLTPEEIAESREAYREAAQGGA